MAVIIRLLDVCSFGSPSPSLHGLRIHLDLHCLCPSIQQGEHPPSLWHVWVIWDIILPLGFVLLKGGGGGKKQIPGSELPTCFSYLFPGNLMTSFGKRMCFCRHKTWLCWPERLGDMKHVLTSENARSLQAQEHVCQLYHANPLSSTQMCPVASWRRKLD